VAVNIKIKPYEWRLSVLVALLLVFQVAQAAVKLAPAPKAGLDSGNITTEPLGGLVINRTITVLGWDFYSYFSEAWRNLHPNTPFTVTVYERPTAQYGSEIWIDYDARRVFHIFLPPARSATKQISQQAASTVYQTITNYVIQNALHDDVDLAPKEM